MVSDSQRTSLNKRLINGIIGKKIFKSKRGIYDVFFGVINVLRGSKVFCNVSSHTDWISVAGSKSKFFAMTIGVCSSKNLFGYFWSRLPVVYFK